MPAGRRRAPCATWSAISRPRRLQLTQPAALDVDLDLEASFRSSPFPCIAEGHPRESLSRAARLGSWIGLKEVIVLRWERSADGSRSLLATVVQVPTAEKVREASMEIGRPHEREGLAGLLANYEDIDVVATTARQTFVPLTVGGGVRAV